MRACGEQEAADGAAVAAPTETEIAALFDQWNAALATGNPETVAALYAADAVLEPTVSNNVRSTPQEIREYFVDFCRTVRKGRSTNATSTSWATMSPWISAFTLLI